jgi:hypothetical protein
MPVGLRQPLQPHGRPPDLLLGVPQLVQEQVQAEPQLRQECQATEQGDGRLRPVAQPGRLGDPVLQQEPLDLGLDRAGLADQLLAEPQHLAIGLHLLRGDADRVEQPLGRELGQSAAIQAVALGLRADRGQQLGGGDDLRLIALGPQAAGQAEARRPGLVDDLGDLPPDRLQPLDEDLRPGGLDPGGQEPALGAVEGDAVGRLVDIDADVDRLALLEAQRLGGGADDLELSRLGVRHGQDLRSETRESPTQVCAPNGSSASMLSTHTPSLDFLP